MSFNQSRSDKNETQYRNIGRSTSFNQHRGSSGAYGKGSGGPGAGGTAPSPSIISNRSYKKSNNNAQGGKSRAKVNSVNYSDYSNLSTQHGVQNGTNPQPQFQGASDVPISSTAAKQTELTAPHKFSGAVSKAATSQSASLSFEATTTPTPTKAPVDESKQQFPFQFGSLSPSFMPGMQIPARTSSAPPNLDEQKRDQARCESLRSVPPSLPTPPAPKQQLPKKDVDVFVQPNTAETHAIPKAKKDVHVEPATPRSQTQNPSGHTMTGISMPMPYHQPQVSVKFGGPNQQMQSQGVPAMSFQMPVSIPLTMGNAAQLQQSMFVPGLHPYPMQAQGIMHQGQNLGYTTQIGPQLSPQLGNLGISIGPQYPQQSGAKFAGPRKTTPVKITHPKTHEELRLDRRTDAYSDGGSSGTSPHPIPPQSSHPINYYPSSYNHNIFFPSSLHLSSSQIPPNSQAPRFNYSVNQDPQNVKTIMSTSAVTSLPASKPGTHIHGVSESPSLKPVHDAKNVIASVTSVTNVTVKSAADPMLNSSAAVEKSESLQPQAVHDAKNVIASVTSVPNVTVKSAAVSIGEKAADPMLHISVAIEKSESSKPQLDAEICMDGSLEQSKSSSTSNTSKSMGKNNPCEVLPVPASLRSQASSSLSSTSDAPDEESVQAVNHSVPRRKETHGKSNSIQHDSARTEDHGEKSVSQGPNQFNNNSKTLSKVNQLSCEEFVSQTGQKSVPQQTSGRDAVSAHTVQEVGESMSSCADQDGKLNCLEKCTHPTLDSKDVQGCNVHDDSIMDNQLSRSDSSCSSEVTSLKSGREDQPSAPAQDAASRDLQGDVENVGGVKTVENGGAAEVSFPMSGSKEKPAPELNGSKSTSDAAGICDLYMAYKGPEEQRENVMPTDSIDYSIMNSKHVINSSQEDAFVSEKATQCKNEPDDWEDAADNSKPKLGTSDNGEQDCGGIVHDENYGNGTKTKKYSRDFLLKFEEKCTELPEGLSDIPDILITAVVSVSHPVGRDSYPSPGRNNDRTSGPPRLDHRGSGVIDDDRWSKMSSPYGSGRDMRSDVGFGGNAGFRPGQVGNYGVFRNPRSQTPIQYAGGILSGPMQAVGSQVAMQRNSPDADRWQRATNFQQKGLAPSPQTPHQVMHKAERKYEVGKVTDEEQAKQRLLKGILNKLTPQNFEKLFEQVKAVNIDNAGTLTGVISQIFDKALMEPTFCEMYANFCYYLAGELPAFNEDNEKITFKRLLLNKCQEEFERGEREQKEANEAGEEGQANLSGEEREEKRLKARRQMLGNIRLIGELYKKGMLTEKIMHECIKKLLGQNQTPDEEDVESLCKLMSTIGEIIDHPKAKAHMDAYFDRMQTVSNNMKLSSRVRFMLKDAIDLRKNKWHQRRKVDGPKKIEEVHRDAAQERQAQTSRLGRGPSINLSARRGPTEFAPRGSSMLFTPNSQMGSFRGMPPQVRGFGTQAGWFEEQQFEARTLSVPLTQRPVGANSITLGPQGGLARGMSSRGPSSMSTAPLADVSSATVDTRRTASGLNGYGSLSDRTTSSPREDLVPTYMSDRFAGPGAYDQSSVEERSTNYGNRDPRNSDCSLDRSIQSSTSTRGQGSVLKQIAPLEKVLPEERLLDMSMAMIKEFYSARDEKEVTLCIKDMNSPSFHPTMVSLWVAHSFEMKDLERDLLAKLLVNLIKSREAILSRTELVKGFEPVLATLEDTVNDAPKAPEFLGRLFAKVIAENVVSLKEIGQLILEGGEEPGLLQEAGIAADVIGHVLESIELEKGETVLNEISSNSNLQLERFRPPDPLRSKVLEKFI